MLKKRRESREKVEEKKNREEKIEKSWTGMSDRLIYTFMIFFRGKSSQERGKKK